MRTSCRLQRPTRPSSSRLIKGHGHKICYATQAEALVVLTAVLVAVVAIIAVVAIVAVVVIAAVALVVLNAALKACTSSYYPEMQQVHSIKINLEATH